MLMIRLEIWNIASLRRRVVSSLLVQYYVCRARYAEGIDALMAHSGPGEIIASMTQFFRSPKVDLFIRLARFFLHKNIITLNRVAGIIQLARVRISALILAIRGQLN